MYKYEYDEETGGLLLTTSQLAFSKEPRPVYSQELDLLGFDKYWTYEKTDAYPYMWAEASTYIYRGRKVANITGGNCYTAPEITILEDPEPAGVPLRPVDISTMVEKNRLILNGLVQNTIKDVYNTFRDYEKKVDVFYVAFSGGKDSVVTLDIVQRALPHNEFKVLFGDTGMEYPDTYDEVEKIEEYCSANGIEFLRAKSEYKPTDTWKVFGPPATVTRWCCSVHKTAPQILTLRRITGKSNFTGMAFIGIRASESLARSEYEYVSLGEKHKGQYSCNPILEWNSAELYTYIYQQHLSLNEAYRRGNRRAGCLVCPRAAERMDYVSRSCYTEEFDQLINIVRDLYQRDFDSEEKLDEFIANGGWKARKNGRDLPLEAGYHETEKNGVVTLTIGAPKTDWKEWIKTIGILTNDESPYKILFQSRPYTFELQTVEDGGYVVTYDSSLEKTDTLFTKLLKNVFRKAACCVTCHVCEADCHNGCISMENGKVHISDSCVHCTQCHKVPKGCLRYKSLEEPKGGLLMSEKKSLNCYSHHAPRRDWINQYFKYKNDFDEKNTLGSQMKNFFKRFLRDSELLDKDGFTYTAEVIDKMGLENLSSWAIMLVNLSYTPQINWYVKRVKMDDVFPKDYAISLLVNDGAKESWVNDIWTSFGRFTDLPFNEVGMGTSEKEKNHIVAIHRTPWKQPDPKVILYALYKFAEGCGGYYQFTLSRLMNSQVDSEGVSPAEIFGLNKEEMVELLNGLTVNYPEYINVSFTHDLDNITLREDKSSKDVLGLF